MAVKKSNTLVSLLKWAIVFFVIYSIWKCVKQDSETFENFESEQHEKKEHKQHEKKEHGEKENVKEGMCSGSSGGTGGSCISISGGKLLPVLDGGYNLREICKQSILLEDHLFQKEKQCRDCVVKHFLTIEGLAEEAITLDKNNEYNLAELNLPERIRVLERQFIENEDCGAIAQQLRQIRKPLMVQYFDKF